MTSASALRIEIERTLEDRFPAALSPLPRAHGEFAPIGIAEVDGLLGGGLPTSAISEIIGVDCSGRTSLALAFVANRTRQGMACAWVDVADSLDAESAAATGVCLGQLLWVRCRHPEDTAGRSAPAKPWSRLDQALRATDLLLQAGGFAALVLDLGSIAPEHSCHIPLATWFRFRQAAHRMRCSLLLLAQTPLAQSSSAVQLECVSQGTTAAAETVLSGMTYQVRVSRQRHFSSVAGQSKPPATTWTAVTCWQREKQA